MSNTVKAIWERYFEPDREKHPKLCQESREMFKTCVKNSHCFKNTEDFKKCAREEINAECVPYRIDFFRCKRFMVDRSKDFRKDPRHGI
jgi:hypothetical protein